MCSLHLTHPSVHTWSSGQPTVQRPGSSRGLPVRAGIRTHNLGLPRVSTPTLYPLGQRLPKACRIYSSVWPYSIVCFQPQLIFNKKAFGKTSRCSLDSITHAHINLKTPTSYCMICSYTFDCSHFTQNMVYCTFMVLNGLPLGKCLQKYISLLYWHLKCVY